MEYKPVTAVWEITMGCNMRCKHCGSGCTDALDGELTTAEALKLCEEIGEMGVQWVALSGGEPTLRPDWHLLAKGLKDNGVFPNLITNGWLLNKEIVDQAVAAGVNTLAISLDGLEQTHDYIRRKGSFRRIMAALDLLQNRPLRPAVITTVNSMNIHELPALKEILVQKKVHGWQLQLGLLMGNLTANSHLVIHPSHVEELIDFAHAASLENSINVELADSVGYYSKKEIAVRKKSLGMDAYHWEGCHAGKRAFGILHNGDIVACTSIRDRRFIEGNIRQTPLRRIWEDPDKFSWNRAFNREQLEGFCGKCAYGCHCRGGCANIRLTLGKSIHAENKYCAYHLVMSRADAQFAKLTDSGEMKQRAARFAAHNNYQLAELLLRRVLDKDGNDWDALNQYGYVCFKLGNYREAKFVNARLLEHYPENASVLHGYGLSLARLGDVAEGIRYMKEAMRLADASYTEPCLDLAAFLAENNRKAEAVAIIEEGRSRFADFTAQSRELYEYLTGS